MNWALVDEVVNAVLYEGYILYPYRSSSTKNQRERFTFGRIYPEAYSTAQKGAESCEMQTECLVQTLAEAPLISVTVRFLQPIWREVCLLPSALPDAPEKLAPPFDIVPSLTVGGKLYQTWQEATEREIKLSSFTLRTSCRSGFDVPLRFPASETLEPVHDEKKHVPAVLRWRNEAIQGRIEVDANPLSPDIFKLTVRVRNLTRLSDSELKDQNAVMLRVFASTHTILHAQEASFISLLDPPPDLQQAVEGCRNIGGWPVLIGDEKTRPGDTVLSSPIILYDYPRIASESRGDFFDATEIDEMLTLRIMTMTDEEKREMRNLDANTRRLLERTEAMTQDTLLKMHGILRPNRSFDEQLFGGTTRLDGVSVNDVYLKPGQRVRIRPRTRADVMDLAIAGRTAIIEAVEQDAESRVHLALVLEDDPGKDLGMLRQPGHRFFYGTDEVEPLREDS